MRGLRGCTVRRRWSVSGRVGFLCAALGWSAGCGRIGYGLESPVPGSRDGTVATFDGALSPDGSDGFDGGPRDAASDAGRSLGDTGMTDGDVSLTGCPPGLTGAYFCDSFEAIPGVWSYNGGAAAESGVVRTGSGSARFDFTDTTERELGRTLLPNPPTSGSVYLRAYVRIESAGSFSAIEVARIGSSNDPGTGRFDRVGITIRDSWYTVFNGIENTEYLGGGATVPRDRWYCLELDVNVDAANGSVTLRADGIEEIAQTGLNTAAFQGYDFVGVGGTFLQGITGTVTVYVEDIVLSRQPIGC